MPVCGETRRAQHNRPGTADELAELVRQCGELAELDHVVGRHLDIAVPLGRAGSDRVRRCGDLLLAKIEARVHDGLSVEVSRDVDVLAFHTYPTVSAAPGRYVMTGTYPPFAGLTPGVQAVVRPPPSATRPARSRSTA